MLAEFGHHMRVRTPVIRRSNATNVGPYRVHVAQADDIEPGIAENECAHVVRIRPQADATPRMDAISDRVVAICCPIGLEADQLTSAPLLGWLAAEHSDICIVGRLAIDESGGACWLSVCSPSECDLPVAARPLVIRGTVVYAGASRWLPMRGIYLRRTEQPDAVVSSLESELTAALTNAGLPALDAHARRHGVAPLAESLRRRVREAELEAIPPLAKAAADLDATLVARPGVGRIHGELRTIQERCLQLYGRLEPERGLVWALEELGELAQAVRRSESTVRMEEELGHVMAWAFCLANILRIDAAHAFGKAYQQEVGRQVRKYGAIHPYRRQAGKYGPEASRS